MAALYIGLMSGTSLDGVDAVLVDLGGPPLQVLGHCSAPFPDTLKAELLALNTPSDNELHRAALAANALVRVYAGQVLALLTQCQLRPIDIRAIGAHGQTVRHRPQEFDGTGYTLQLNQPALLAELCGIDVVADFRSRDVAAGGQGAPLVPPFHQAFFAKPRQTTAVLNIGGISNVSVLGAEPENILGFDCGPGNALMDAWCQQHTGQAYDAEGRWAATGQVDAALLTDLQADAYFSKLPPKSTGRDFFNSTWLAHKLMAHPQVLPVDVQATLTALTAWACADSVRKSSPTCQTLIVCGGGALNLELMRRLQLGLPSCVVESSVQHGLPPLQVEATAFAWLAQQAIERKTGSLKSVTGARGARILGAIYPA
ncbi:MAG: anhydro-N-acetylmuramic acid kinase [Burkholderiales bacterium PBB3]|nr:MAG: anhydro-N-acetylmuramic acid kinase [Burkholderiales bacterium PBB3]